MTSWSDPRPQAVLVRPALTPEARAVALQRLAHAAADLAEAAKDIQAAAQPLGEDWLRQHPELLVRMGKLLAHTMELEQRVGWAVRDES